MEDVRLDTNWLDYTILLTYFLVVLGVGSPRSATSGRPRLLPVGPLAARMDHRVRVHLGQPRRDGGARQAANGAQYGIATVHFYWIGAVPAMVFLGLVMMPFYYGAKVRSVPEYLRLRFNEGTHAFNAVSFAAGTVLIAGVNLFALALVMHLMLGWSIDVAILAAAGNRYWSM